MKKIYIVTGFVTLLLVSFLGVTYSYEYNGDSLLEFKLLGDYEIYLNRGDPYIEYGVKVYNGDDDLSDLVYIDKSNLNINKSGSYKVKYEISLGETKEYVYRIVHVLDKNESKIKLLGDSVIYLELGEDYVEPGYEVINNDNFSFEYDVIITSNLDIFSIGEYSINYMLLDEKGNKTVVVRKIIIR